MRVESRKEIVKKIMTENKLDGPASYVVFTFIYYAIMEMAKEK
jgi:hypothetical protein